MGRVKQPGNYIRVELVILGCTKTRKKIKRLKKRTCKRITKINDQKKWKN